MGTRSAHERWCSRNEPLHHHRRCECTVAAPAETAVRGSLKEHVPGAVGAWLLGWPIPSVPDRLVSTGGGRIKQPSSGRPFEERPESVLSCWDGAACPVDD